MYSSSQTWRADRAKARERNKRLLRARSHICPESTFFSKHFNFQQQSTVMRKERELYSDARRESAIVAPLYPAFGGKKFKPSCFAVFDETYPYASVPTFREPGATASAARLYKGKHLVTILSPILCEPTIWQSDYIANKNIVCLDDFSQNRCAIAPYPCLAELKCEGPDRIASRYEHRRFLPYPRENRNETVSWTQRPFLKPHRLDGLQEAHVLTQEDIITNDLELDLPNTADMKLEKDSNLADDEEKQDPYKGNTARRLLGDSLFEALDPKHVYF